MYETALDFADFRINFLKFRENALISFQSYTALGAPAPQQLNATNCK